MSLFSHILIGTLFLSLIACNSKGSKNSQRVGEAGFEKESCEFTYNQGDNHGYYADELKTTYFSKAYGRHHLKNIQKASAAQTYKYMSNQGQVNVYRSTDTKNGCPLFKEIPRAQGDLQRFWNETAGGIDSDTQRLLGVYLPNNYTSLPGFEATIMLRNDTSRWTLVHEFMHHLFELESIKAGKSQNKLSAGLTNTREQLVLKSRELDNSNATKYSEIKKPLQETINLFAQLLSIFDDLVVNSALEEMTIESELMGDYSSFSYMPKNFESSKSYIRSSYEKAVDLYDSLKSQLKAIDGLILAASAEKVQLDTQSYEAIKRVIENRKSEMRSVYYRSESVPSLVQFNPASLLSLPSFSDERETVAEINCPHTQATIELLKNIF